MPKSKPEKQFASNFIGAYIVPSVYCVKLIYTFYYLNIIFQKCVINRQPASVFVLERAQLDKFDRQGPQICPLEDFHIEDFTMRK